MRMIVAIVIVSLLAPGVGLAQGGPPSAYALGASAPRDGDTQTEESVWREFSGRLDVGSELKVRLVDGTRFNATLVRVDQTGLLLQPRTRVPVPVQPVAYDSIASLAPVKKGGIGAGKAIAIGVGTGVAAFWGTFLVVLALVGD